MWQMQKLHSIFKPAMQLWLCTGVSHRMLQLTRCEWCAGTPDLYQHAHGNHVYSPRNTHDAGFQAPSSYAAGTARPQHPVYNEAYDDRPLPGESFPHSAPAPPAQEAPQGKDRSEGREFFRRCSNLPDLHLHLHWYRNCSAPGPVPNLH